ncbi:5'-nucleotidase-like [Asterias rubens]|uniref:5'-nucleotidase-like n=1 Tax=Asterias rubens TaxID=7604 RepID=UPI001454EE4F|nr:5'-nucleotidase-like [Asterias rubens]
MGAKFRLYVLSLILSLAPIVCLTSAYDLTILHTNDVHAHFEQFDKYSTRCDDDESANGQCFGGVARTVTKVRQIRSEVDNVVLLDAGDQFQGTPWFSFYKGKATSHFMNVIGYEVMAFGNHEFDNGPEGLTTFLNDLDAQVVCANMDASNEPAIDGLFTKSTVLAVGGEMIGIVGYTLSRIRELSTTVGSLVFMDEVSSIQAEVDRLIAVEGVNKIIALGHSGFEVDLKIARQVRGMDIVVGGHSNTFMYTGDPPGAEIPSGVYPTVVHPDADPTANVLVVQDYKLGKYLGRLDVTFDDEGNVIGWGGNPILIDKDIEEDAAVLEEIEAWGESIRNYSNVYIASTNVFLDGTSCRLMECNLGNLVSDAYLRHGIRDLVDGVRLNDANIALFNAGGIRSQLPVGDITVGDVTSILPFGNTADQITLKGKHILEALEHSVAEYTIVGKHGEFLQHAGMLVTFDLSRTRGNRVVSAEVRCTECEVPEFHPLDPEAEYKVILSTYLVDGGDGYTMITNNTITHDFGTLDIDVVTEYLQLLTPMTVGLDRRITLLEPKDDVNECNAGSTNKSHRLIVLSGLLSLVLHAFSRI